MIQGTHVAGRDYNYELDVNETYTEVRFSFINVDDGKRYTSHFLSGFKGAVQNALDLTNNKDGIQLFALQLSDEEMETVKFFVPSNEFSDVVAVVLNRWARETGAPFAFRLAPGVLTILEVTFPAQIHTAINKEVKKTLIDSVNRVFQTLVITTDEVIEEEAELDLLDDENAVIVEEDDIDNETKDGFKSSLYDDIEGGNEEDE